MNNVAIVMCAIGAALAVPAQAPAKENARMYKCIDAAGKAYYSDKLNPDCGQSSELNSQGVVMPKKEVAKPSGKAAKGEPVAQVVTGSKQQERRDRALMATYTSEDEIDAARDRTLAIPAEGTKAVESRLDKVNERLTELKQQADALASQKKKLPAQLLEDVDATNRQVIALAADLSQRKSQADAIRARFELDKQRFRELKGAAPQ